AMRASLASGQVRGGSRGATTIEELMAGGFIVVGSPDTVSERIAELSETLGFEHLGVNLTVGSIAESQARENIEAFAKEVIPRFRSAAEQESVHQGGRPT
ncbi:MAG: hypothetical protein J2O47_10340, partial [Acidimicrobiaceae bacterium]|nr:hypothetical protein [Acidimicrobiaceae bacterium]